MINNNLMNYLKIKQLNIRKNSNEPIKLSS
jgi:hypothetical protein